MVIIDGLIYVISFLDIFKDKDGNFIYKGLYEIKVNDIVVFDKVV